MTDDDSEPDWEEIGRRVLASHLNERGADADDAIQTLVATLRNDTDPDPDDVIVARRELNELRRVLEREVAPAAGVEPWGRPRPDLPVEKWPGHQGVNDE